MPFYDYYAPVICKTGELIYICENPADFPAFPRGKCVANVTKAMHYENLTMQYTEFFS